MSLSLETFRVAVAPDLDEFVKNLGAICKAQEALRPQEPQQTPYVATKKNRGPFPCDSPAPTSLCPALLFSN